MSWERRTRGGRYYTRTRRIQGRVVREYVGTGALAELAAAVDEAERAQTAARRAAVATERADAETLAASVDDAYRLTERLLSAALTSQGFHRHRSEWRRKRD